MTEWERQPKIFTEKKDMVIRLRKRGFSLSNELLAALPRKSAYAEIFISKDKEKIAFSFMPKETDWSFPISMGKTRTIEAAELIKHNPDLHALASQSKNGTTITVVPEGDKFVGALERVFIHDDTDGPLDDESVGVFRLYVGGDIVLIGSGSIKSQIAKIAGRNLPFDRYEYFLTSDEFTARKHQSKIMSQYRAIHNDTPLLNKKLRIA